MRQARRGRNGACRCPRAGAFGAALLLAIAACAPATRAGPVPTRPALVDDVAAARQLLEEERTAARLASGDPPARRVLRLVQLGLFQDADSLLTATRARSLDLAAAEADLRFRQYRFADARELVEAVLQQQAGHRPARHLSIQLAIQAWQLDWAAEQARAMLARRRRDPTAALLLGRVHLLQREYDAALSWAERSREWDPGAAGAYRLEADVHFWLEQPAKAEAALRRSLEIDPLNADARFDYGYALWRRGAPALLGAMAAQWNLALELDPLHLETHWHLGNGHTLLTYADYAAVADTLARAALAPVDSLIVAGQPEEAVALTRALETEFPGSVLPALWRGSIHYMLAEGARPVALDSAERAFRTILAAAPNFGPAHNGLAAVLKQRQFRALAAYDSLEAAIALTPVPARQGLHEVFPDLRFYPGDRVEKMVAQQLGPAIAYLPLLRRQDQRVFIPPLHRDLAAATGDASFRTAVTFDNRRWMDIRGVGGERLAAAGIEYLERGSHLERGVLLHELFHLVHASVLTDAQVRRVRELYLVAMEDGRTLDYYSASNDQEFLAQAVEAYRSPIKAHPLNHKSLNTREDLRRTDPETFAFVEALVADMERALSGDPYALRSNWAQVYVNLAEQARRDRTVERGRRLERAAELLDSALVWDAAYVPAMLGHAAVEGERGRLGRAEEWLRHAEGIAPNHAPILAARADLIAREGADVPGAGDTRAWLLRRAAEIEHDPQLRAGYFRDLWELYVGLGRVPEAIAIAEEYAASGPTISTRLREAREDAALAAVWLRSEAGYAEDALPVLRERVAAAPMDFDLRGRYADALVIAGREAEAVEVLEDARAILAPAGDPRREIYLPLAELRLAAGDTSAARDLAEPLLDRDSTEDEAVDGRLVRLLISLGESTEAQRRLAALPEAREPAQRAELAFTRGWISEWRRDVDMAAELYAEAVSADPYHLRARLALYRLLRAQGRLTEARAVAEAAARLPLPLGPRFQAAIQATER